MLKICSLEAMSNRQVPAAEGAAHKVRRTPEGGARRDWTDTPCLQNLHTEAGFPSAASPSKLEQMLFDMRDLQILKKCTRKEIPLGGHNLHKPENAISTATQQKLQTNFEHDVKIKARQSQNQVFRCRHVVFLQLCSITNKVQK